MRLGRLEPTTSQIRGPSLQLGYNIGDKNLLSYVPQKIPILKTLLPVSLSPFTCEVLSLNKALKPDKQSKYCPRLTFKKQRKDPARDPITAKRDKKRKSNIACKTN